jgi:hypothetical protein
MTEDLAREGNAGEDPTSAGVRIPAPTPSSDPARVAPAEPSDDMDDQPPASPAESLRLIHAQRAHAERQFTPDPRLLYWPWGITWMTGFGLLFLRFGPDGRVLVNLPEWLPLTTLFTLMVVSVVITMAGGRHAGRHLTGESSTKGMRYGLAWGLGFAGLSATLGRVSDVVPDAELGLLWAGASVALVAALYLAGAAIWGDRHMFVLGCWWAAINVVGVVAGPGWHSLVISLAGGGAGLVAGLVGWLRLRRVS